MKEKVITARISNELLARLKKASDKRKNPYAPTITQIIERGLDLALSELETKKG